MVQVYSEYNADVLTADQIARLQGALEADLDAMAEMDNEPDPEPGAEAEAEAG